MKRYYPILLSKPGEFTALANLIQNVKDEITPVIEVLNESVIDKEGNYLSRLQDELIEIWSFDDNQIFLDFTFFDDLDRNITIIRRLFNALFANGVNVVPVVKFNSPTRYLNLIANLITAHSCGACIRTNNESGGFINYNANVAALIARINVTENDTSLLIDLGFAEATNYNLLATAAYQTITTIHNIQNWANIIVASGSFLSDLGGLPAPATNTSPARLYRLQRYEWDIWTVLNGQQLPREIRYSDYGTKHPYFTPAGYEGSCSIKYTTTHQYVIYRGRKASDHARGGGQYNISAHTLIGSPDFTGSAFSWGDNEIDLIGNRTNRPGNAGSWVKISQNHHITFLHSLL